MYAVVIKDRFFNAGYSFNQLISVEGTLGDATRFTDQFVRENPEFKNHLIILEEIFIDDVSRVALKPIRNS